MQVSLAGVAAMVYFGIQSVFVQTDLEPLTAATGQLRLQAGLASELDVLISNPSIIVPVAFILGSALVLAVPIRNPPAPASLQLVAYRVRTPEKT